MYFKDDDAFFTAIKAARAQLSLTPVANSQNTRNRITDSIGYALDIDDKTIGGFIKAWKEKINGSSACMIATFFDCLRRQPPKEFTVALNEVRAELKAKYREEPKPFGLYFAFQIVTAMVESGHADRRPALRDASDVLELMAKKSNDVGFRCFSALLKGFAYNL